MKFFIFSIVIKFIGITPYITEINNQTANPKLIAEIGISVFSTETNTTIMHENMNLSCLCKLKNKSSICRVFVVKGEDFARYQVHQCSNKNIINPFKKNNFCTMIERNEIHLMCIGKKTINPFRLKKDIK